MKRKKKRMSPEERAAWEARADAQVRRLRELAAKGRAQLDAQRRAN
jgi:hypothetical protein